jgi:hypothetical protein
MIKQAIAKIADAEVEFQKSQSAPALAVSVAPVPAAHVATKVLSANDTTDLNSIAA